MVWSQIAGGMELMGTALEERVPLTELDTARDTELVQDLHTLLDSIDTGACVPLCVERLSPKKATVAHKQRQCVTISCCPLFFSHTFFNRLLVLYPRLVLHALTRLA